MTCLKYIAHVGDCGIIPGHEDECACGCDAYGDWCVIHFIAALCGMTYIEAYLAQESVHA